MKRLLCFAMAILMILTLSNSLHITASAETPTSEQNSFSQEFFDAFSNFSSVGDININIQSTMERKVYGEKITDSFRISGNSTSGLVTISDYQKSIEIRYYANMYENPRVEPKLVKSSIKTTLFALDKQATESVVNEAVATLANTYDGKTYSNIVTFGDYSLFLEPVMFSESITFYALHTSSFIPDRFDTSSYIPGNASLIEAPLNDGEHYYVSGIVASTVNVGLNDIPRTILQVKTADESRVNVSYTYSSLPIVFKDNMTYTFYGTARSFSGGMLMLDYFTAE